MALSSNQLQLLRNYLDNNSSTYDPLTDQEVAGALNLPSVIKVKATITGSELYSATDGSEFSLLSDLQKLQWLSLCNFRELDPDNGTPAHSLAIDLFPASTTLSNLSTIREELVSIAENNGFPVVRAEDVRLARLL